jgi:hypothetical protein
VWSKAALDFLIDEVRQGKDIGSVGLAVLRAPAVILVTCCALISLFYCIFDILDVRIIRRPVMTYRLQ